MLPQVNELVVNVNKIQGNELTIEKK